MTVDWKPRPKDYMGDEEKLLIESGAMTPPDFSGMAENPGTPLFPKVVQYQDRYFHPATRAEQVICALYCFQAWAIEVLSDVFFLFLAGPPGSGKSNQLESLTLLTDGALENDVTRSVLGRYFPTESDTQEGEDCEVHQGALRRRLRRRAVRSLGIDEASTRAAANELAERDRLLRASYQRTIGNTYSRYNVETGRIESWNTFGPKMMALTGSVDPGLASRGFVITAAKVSGEEHYQLVLNKKRRMVDGFHKQLVSEFRAWNRWVTQWWTADRVASLQASENHRAAVRSVVSELGANRESELLCTAVTVAMLAGVDLTAELREMAGSLGAAGDEDEDADEEVLDAIIAVAQRQAVLVRSEEIVLKQVDVQKFINEGRSHAEPPMRPLISKPFAESYRKYIPARFIRNRGGRNYWVIPTSHLANLKALLEGGLVNLPNLVNIRDNPVQQSLKVDQVDRVDQGGME